MTRIKSLCIVFIALRIFCTGIDIDLVSLHCTVIVMLPCHAFVVIMLYIVINK